MCKTQNLRSICCWHNHLIYNASHCWASTVSSRHRCPEKTQGLLSSSVATTEDRHKVREGSFLCALINTFQVRVWGVLPLVREGGCTGPSLGRPPVSPVPERWLWVMGTAPAILDRCPAIHFLQQKTIYQTRERKKSNKNKLRLPEFKLLFFYFYKKMK